MKEGGRLGVPSSTSRTRGFDKTVCHSGASDSGTVDRLSEMDALLLHRVEERRNPGLSENWRLSNERQRDPGSVAIWHHSLPGLPFLCGEEENYGRLDYISPLPESTFKHYRHPPLFDIPILILCSPNSRKVGPRTASPLILLTAIRSCLRN